MLPNGEEIVYETRIHFKSLEKCGETICVQIYQEYDSSGISSLSNSIINSLSNGNTDKIINYKANNQSSIKGKVIRHIDPPTSMNIHYEKIERTINMKMDIPNQGVTPVKMKETAISEITYH